MLGFTNAFAQTTSSSTGLAGGKFDLYGALDLFKKADSPESFEKAINADDNNVNKLDLDGDGKADYITVVNKKDSAILVFVLQVTVSDSEIRYIAAIGVAKNDHDKADAKIIGDEALCVKNDIIQSEAQTEIAADEKTGSGKEYKERDEALYGKNDIIQPATQMEIAAGKKTGSDTEYDESDDDVYATTDKSGYTYIDLQTIEPVVTKIGYGIGYFMVDIMGPVLKDALHAMFKSMIEEAIPFLKTD